MADFVIGRADFPGELRESHLVELQLAPLYAPRERPTPCVQTLVAHAHALRALYRHAPATLYGLRAARGERSHARVLKHKLRALAREIQTPRARGHKPDLPVRLLPLHEDFAPLPRLLVPLPHVYDLPGHPRVETPRLDRGLKLVESHAQPYVPEAFGGCGRDP